MKQLSSCYIATLLLVTCMGCTTVGEGDRSATGSAAGSPRIQAFLRSIDFGIDGDVSIANPTLPFSASSTAERLGFGRESTLSPRVDATWSKLQLTLSYMDTAFHGVGVGDAVVPGIGGGGPITIVDAPVETDLSIDLLNLIATYDLHAAPGIEVAPGVGLGRYNYSISAFIPVSPTYTVDAEATEIVGGAALRLGWQRDRFAAEALYLAYPGYQDLDVLARYRLVSSADVVVGYRSIDAQEDDTYGEGIEYDLRLQTSGPYFGLVWGF